MRWIDEQGRTEGLVKEGDKRRKFRAGTQMSRKNKNKKNCRVQEIKNRTDKRKNA